MKMTVKEIQGIAEKMGLKANKTKKAELVRMIQIAEENTPCFQTGSVRTCGQENCLWLSDCK
jgi:hypothetical protein